MLMNPEEENQLAAMVSYDSRKGELFQKTKDTNEQPKKQTKGPELNSASTAEFMTTLEGKVLKAVIGLLHQAGLGGLVLAGGLLVGTLSTVGVRVTPAVYKAANVAVSTAVAIKDNATGKTSERQFYQLKEVIEDAARIQESTVAKQQSRLVEKVTATTEVIRNDLAKNQKTMEGLRTVLTNITKPKPSVRLTARIGLRTTVTKDESAIWANSLNSASRGTSVESNTTTATGNLEPTGLMAEHVLPIRLNNGINFDALPPIKIKLEPVIEFVLEGSIPLWEPKDNINIEPLMSEVVNKSNFHKDATYTNNNLRDDTSKEKVTG